MLYGAFTYMVAAGLWWSCNCETVMRYVDHVIYTLCSNFLLLLLLLFIIIIIKETCGTYVQLNPKLLAPFMKSNKTLNP